VANHGCCAQEGGGRSREKRGRRSGPGGGGGGGSAGGGGSWGEVQRNWGGDLPSVHLLWCVPITKGAFLRRRRSHVGKMKKKGVHFEECLPVAIYLNKQERPSYLSTFKNGGKEGQGGGALYIDLQAIIVSYNTVIGGSSLTRGMRKETH